MENKLNVTQLDREGNLWGCYKVENRQAVLAAKCRDIPACRKIAELFGLDGVVVVSPIVPWRNYIPYEESIKMFSDYPAPPPVG